MDIVSPVCLNTIQSSSSPITTTYVDVTTLMSMSMISGRAIHTYTSNASCTSLTRRHSVFTRSDAWRLALWAQAFCLASSQSLFKVFQRYFPLKWCIWLVRTWPLSGLTFGAANSTVLLWTIKPIGIGPFSRILRPGKPMVMPSLPAGCIYLAHLIQLPVTPVSMLTHGTRQLNILPGYTLYVRPCCMESSPSAFGKTSANLLLAFESWHNIASPLLSFSALVSSLQSGNQGSRGSSTNAVLTTFHSSVHVFTLRVTLHWKQLMLAHRFVRPSGQWRGQSAILAKRSDSLQTLFLTLCSKAFVVVKLTLWKPWSHTSILLTM